MGKRTGFSLGIAMLGCILSAACTGTPPTFNQVMLTPNGPITLGSSGTQTINAAVLNDTSGAGVTWSTPAHGTLSNITTTSATYHAPAVAAGSSITDSVTATSVTFPNQSSTLSVTVEGAPIISTMSLPGGNEGTAYNQAVSSSGGVGPYTWSISNGALPAGLSLSASTTASVTISGTPTAQGTANFTIKITDSTGASGTQALSIAIGAPLPLSVTTTTLPGGIVGAAYPGATLQATGGIPPFTWLVTSAAGTFPPGLTLNNDGSITGTSTTAGTYNFTVQVTDSETPAQHAPANLSIVISNSNALNGNYVFELSGFTGTTFVAMAGSFTADGKGDLTSGVEDFNSTTGSPKNQTFTGSYTLGADNRGVLTFTSLAGSPAFAFAIDSLGEHGRMIEFDSSGIRGSGQIEQRSLNTCTATTLNGQYVFGVTGQVIANGVSTAGPVVIVGSIGATPGAGATPGSIGNTEDDASAPGNVISQNVGWGGSFQTTVQSTRCTMNLDPSLSPTNGFTYSVYPISTSEAFLVETDAVNSNEPFLTIGKMILQTGYPFFGGGEFPTNTASVAGLTGQFFNGTSYIPDMAIISVSGVGNATYSISAVENQGGIVTTASSPGLTFTQSDQFGRLETDITPIDPTFYMVNDNMGFCIGDTLNDPFFGIIEPQSTGPFTASALNGNFVLGTSFPATAPVRDLSGAVTLANSSSTAGSISGTEDISASNGNTAAATVTGTYSGLNSSTGAGVTSLTAPTNFSGQFFVVSPTKIVVLSTTGGDTNPVVIFLGNCAVACGED